MDQDNGAPKTFFRKKREGGGSSSSKPVKNGRSRADMCVTVRHIADDVRRDGFTELFEDVRAPRPFVKFRDSDKPDLKAPVDTSIDNPSDDFDFFSKQVSQSPTPRDEMECIVEDGGVRKQVHLESPISNSSSSSGSPVIPSDGCRVWIHYNTYVERGNALLLIDSTRKHRIATALDVGEEGLLGLYFAVKSMKKKEVAEFLLDPEYAYGRMGIPGFIGGNERLRMVVQLEDIMSEPPKENVELMDLEEVEELAAPSSSETVARANRDIGMI